MVLYPPFRFCLASAALAILIATGPRALADPPLSGEAIFQLIQDRGVRSVDELLPLLPEEMRSRFSLVTQTRNEVQAASYRSPRIILFSQDGKFLLTVTGSSNVAGGNTIEMISQQADGSWQPMSGRFEGGRFIPERHPTSCQACHGKPLRPIWDSYPRWPGVYGSSHGFLRQLPGERIEVDEYRGHRLKSPAGAADNATDEMFRKSSREARELGDFLKQRATADRYRHLIGLSEMSYHELAELNSRLSEALTMRTNQQIAQRLMAQPDFSRAAAWLLERLRRIELNFSFDPADFDRLPPDLAARAREAFARLEPRRQAQLDRQAQQVGDRLLALDSELYAARAKAGLGLDPPRIPIQVTLSDQRAFTMIEALGEALGVEREFWQAGITGTTRQAGGKLPSYADFFYALADEIGKRDPGFARYLHNSDVAGARFMQIGPDGFARIAQPGYRLPPPAFDCRAGYAKLEPPAARAAGAGDAPGFTK